MFRKATEILVLSGCFLALSACFARADGQGPLVKANMQPSFHRQADLVDWIKKNMIPGHTRRPDVFAVFGTRFWHPWDGFDASGNSRFDNLTFVFDLDALGVHDHRHYDALFFHFDPGSGRLLSAGIEQMERQTGFHLETSSGP